MVKKGGPVPRCERACTSFIFKIEEIPQLNTLQPDFVQGIVVPSTRFCFISAWLTWISLSVPPLTVPRSHRKRNSLSITECLGVEILGFSIALNKSVQITILASKTP